jgi:hypothetical protein
MDSLKMPLQIIDHRKANINLTANNNDNTVRVLLFLSLGGGCSFGGVFPQKGDGIYLCGCG